ncbi:uncharacterized protein JCM10292_000894 [Rhodotorula paludigena]|uniref:uncharacterized protein n=1 Tax=Rhodotorula paludigena TaxID=86838 RepID=UPI00317D70E6
MTPLDAQALSSETSQRKGAAASKPSFFPPLWLARRTACVELLRSENVRSVADLGCGTGAVSSLLTLPAYHLDDFPTSLLGEHPAPADSLLPSPNSGASANSPTCQSRAEKLAILRSIPPVPPSERELHLSRLIGVDADVEACRQAAKHCEPPSAEEDATGRDPRWEELEVEIYHGGVEVYNPALDGVDAIILTEVIEHLSQDALERLPSLLFATYRPRLIIITTPNHAFNPYFPPPSSAPPAPHSTSSSAPEEDDQSDDDDDDVESNPLSAHLHPDPTRRTNPRRLFRDATHTLEWTSDEFRAWCADALAASGAQDTYDVQFSGVGSLKEYYRASRTAEGDGIPFPPPAVHLHPALAAHPLCAEKPAEPESFFATQIAVFRRRTVGEEGTKEDDEEDERKARSPLVSPLTFFPSALPPVSPPPSAPLPLNPTPSKAHTLIASHHHPLSPAPAPSASSASDRSAILAALRALFRAERRGDILSLAALWRAGGPDRRFLASSAGEEESAGPALRELVRGRVGEVMRAVLDAGEGDEVGSGEGGEWELVRLREDEDGSGRGRALTGMDALGIRWVRYEEEVGALEAAEAEAAGRIWLWSDDEDEQELGREERDEGRSDKPADEAPVPPPAAAQTDASDLEPPRWGAPLLTAEGTAQEQHARNSADINGGWGDEPW